MNQEIIQTISEYFKTKKINKAYLFGSFAKGIETDTSDIDILVELSESIGFKKIDLVTPASLSPRILPLIQKDWKLIYERQ